MTGLGDRLLVVGPSGAGKSTLGARLHERFGHDLLDLDALFWLPGWQMPPREEFREDLKRRLEAPRWVVAGNYENTVSDLVWEQANDIIWLDFSLSVSLVRIFKRCWRRHRDEELLWGKCRENFWSHFALWDVNESLYSFTIKHHGPRRRRFERLQADGTLGARFHRLRTQAEADAWWDALG